MEVLKLKRGVTLIALVITIIVLLILAGISISTLLGENGIAIKAKEAKEETTRAEELEKVRLAVMAAKTNKNYEVEKTVLEKELNSYFGKGNYELIGGIEVGYYEIKLLKNIYKVDLNGEIKADDGLESIIIEGDNLVFVGDNLYLCVVQEDGSSILPEEVQWSSSDSSIATVVPTLGKAMVTGVKKGEVKIRATSIYNSDIYDEITVIVDQSYYGNISISGWVSYFEVGDTLYLTAQNSNGETLLAPDVIWETSNSSVATVESVSGQGYVTGISGGTVTITARLTDDPTIFAYVVFNIANGCNKCDNTGSVDVCRSCQNPVDFEKKSEVMICINCYEKDPEYCSAPMCLNCGIYSPSYNSSEGGYICCSEPVIRPGGYICCSKPDVSNMVYYICKNCKVEVYGSIWAGIENIDCPDCDN